MKAALAPVHPIHALLRGVAAALIAVLSICVPQGLSLRADDEAEGEHDGLDDVQKDPKEDRPIFAKDENGKGLIESRCRQRITAICNAGTFAGADDERFFAEFFDVKIGELTWKQNAETLPDVRGKLKQYIGSAAAAPSPDVHDKLNAIVLAKCKKIVADKRFPMHTVRYNAVLMIGDLNQQEKRGGDNATIVPLSEARAYLLTSADDRAMHGALRIAATVGLKRHALTNPTAEVRKSLKDGMLQLLSRREPAEGKKKLAIDWLRMNAAEILGVLASKWDEAKQPDVTKELLAMAADPDVQLWMRCEVAGNLGELDGKSFPADKVMPAARQLADLVVEISALTNKLPGVKPAAKPAAADGDAKKSEANDGRKPDKKSGDKKTADKKAAEKKVADKKSADKKSGDKKNPDKKAADAPATPAAPAVRVTQHVRKVTCDELTYCLSKVRYALTGYVPTKYPVRKNDEAPTGGLLTAATDANAKSFLHELVAKVDKMLAITSGKLEFQELVTQLDDERTQLEQWLKNATAAKPTGAEAAVAGGRK